MEKVKVTYKGQERFGYIIETKQDKVKVSIFDCADFNKTITDKPFAFLDLKWGHHIRDDWFEKIEVEII